MLHPILKWYIDSSALPQIIGLISSWHLSIVPLMTLVQRGCTWAAHAKLSLSRVRDPFFNHCHLFKFLAFLFCLTNRPCNIFSSQETFLYSFFCFLGSSTFSQLGSIKLLYKALQQQACVLWTLANNSLIQEWQSWLFLQYLAILCLLLFLVCRSGRHYFLVKVNYTLSSRWV